MTPARAAVLAYAEAWTYPILGNEDVPVMRRLFKEARALAESAIAAPDDPPEFSRWLSTMLRVKDSSNEWEDTLFEIIDYFGMSADN